MVFVLTQQGGGILLPAMESPGTASSRRDVSQLFTTSLPATKPFLPLCRAQTGVWISRDVDRGCAIPVIVPVIG